MTLQWEDPEDGFMKEPGVIQDASSSGLAVACARDFPRGQTLWIVRPAASAVKSVVRHSDSDGRQYRLGLALVHEERRRFDRTPVTGQGEMRWTGPSGATIRARATVQDVSEGGLQLKLDVAAPVGSTAKLCGEAVECVGSIRYCVSAEGGYLIGLQLISNPWESPELAGKP